MLEPRTAADPAALAAAAAAPGPAPPVDLEVDSGPTGRSESVSFLACGVSPMTPDLTLATVMSSWSAYSDGLRLPVLGSAPTIP